MNKPKLTEGQARVRVAFNPNALKRVETFKNLMASAIDELNKHASKVRVRYGEDNDPGKLNSNIGDMERELATAKTQIQQASMWGVAALTNDLMFKYSKNETVPVSLFQPHEDRVIAEQSALATKCTDLEVFINSNPIFNGLPEVEQEDLKAQLASMTAYHKILGKRIARFIPKESNE